jgi:hypothetical protein
VLVHSPSGLLDAVGGDRDDRDPVRVELRSQFLPSPQLGDTVRSPVAAKELQQEGRAAQRREIEGPAQVIGEGELEDRTADRDRRLLARLRALRRQTEEAGTAEDRNAGEQLADDTRAQNECGQPEHQRDGLRHQKGSTIGRNAHPLDQPEPHNRQPDFEQSPDRSEHRA